MVCTPTNNSDEESKGEGKEGDVHDDGDGNGESSSLAAVAVDLRGTFTSDAGVDDAVEGACGEGGVTTANTAGFSDGTTTVASGSIHTSSSESAAAASAGGDTQSDAGGERPGSAADKSAHGVRVQADTNAAARRRCIGSPPAPPRKLLSRTSSSNVMREARGAATPSDPTRPHVTTSTDAGASDGMRVDTTGDDGHGDGERPVSAVVASENPGVSASDSVTGATTSKPKQLARATSFVVTASASLAYLRSPSRVTKPSPALRVSKPSPHCHTPSTPQKQGAHRMVQSSASTPLGSPRKCCGGGVAWAFSRANCFPIAAFYIPSPVLLSCS